MFYELGTKWQDLFLLLLNIAIMLKMMKKTWDSVEKYQYMRSINAGRLFRKGTNAPGLYPGAFVGPF